MVSKVTNHHEKVRPSKQIDKRANELVGSGERPNHIHGYLSAILEYLDEQYLQSKPKRGGKKA